MHHPGPPRFEAVGSTVDLAPRDPDPAGAYQWRLAEAPERSAATLGDDSVEQFTPDEPGTYTVALDAPDGTHELTIRAFPASYAPPEPGPATSDSGISGSGLRSGSGFQSGSGLRSGYASGSATTAAGYDSGGRPRVQLFARVEGEEVVFEAQPASAPSSDVPAEDLDVEFHADDRDPLDTDELDVDDHEARVALDALGEYSRVHAVALGETFSVADTVGVAVGEDVEIERLNEPPEWGKEVTLYEVYVRTFTGGEAATFDAIADRLEYLSEMGVDCIWLSPVLQNDDFDHGYNITDFFSIADDLGTREEFEAFVDEAHDHGINVLFDLVLNHSAREHEYFERAEDGDPKYRDWYEWDDPENDVPATYFDWPYIANFNFDNLEVRRHLLDAVDEWAPVVDGFRCDMAWAVPTSFWKEVRDRVKDHDSEFLLLDETIPYIADFHELCFDVHFDTTLYHNLRQIGNGAADATAIHDAIDNRAETGFPDHAGFLLYIENHDETRYAEDCGRKQAFAAAGALFTLPGIPLLYAGQEIGEETRREKVEWAAADEELRDHYRSLIETRDAHPALGYEGDYEPVEVEASHGGVVAYARQAEGERVVVVLNFGPLSESVAVDADVDTTDLVSGDDVNAPAADVEVEDVVVLRA